MAAAAGPGDLAADCDGQGGGADADPLTSTTGPLHAGRACAALLPQPAGRPACGATGDRLRRARLQQGRPVRAGACVGGGGGNPAGEPGAGGAGRGGAGPAVSAAAFPLEDAKSLWRPRPAGAFTPPKPPAQQPASALPPAVRRHCRCRSTARRRHYGLYPLSTTRLELCLLQLTRRRLQVLQNEAVWAAHAPAGKSRPGRGPSRRVAESLILAIDDDELATRPHPGISRLPVPAGRRSWSWGVSS